MTTQDCPLLDAAHAALLTLKCERIGVAVSGGSDSMATLHLFARVAADSGASLHAITVDHGLRKEAAAEARTVAEVCSKLGVSHDTVRWEEGHQGGNLLAAARQARYDIIARWANENEIDCVMLGHTQDDQAETVLMRLARSAGVDGLVGIRRGFSRDGVQFLRPFLTHSRSNLQDYLRKNSMSWVDDPSNEDPRFDRIKARQILNALSPLGLKTDQLAAVAENMLMAQTALAFYTTAAAKRLLSFDHGDAILTLNPTPPVPAEIERRLLIAAIQWVSGAVYPPRQSAIDEMNAALIDGTVFTLAGCVVTLDRSKVKENQELRITREFNKVKDLSAPTDQLWDGRWRMDGPHDEKLLIQALGEKGLSQCKNWRESGIARRSLLSSPAIWNGDRLISAPLARNLNGWSAKVEKSRDEFAVNLIHR